MKKLHLLLVSLASLICPSAHAAIAAPQCVMTTAAAIAQGAAKVRSTAVESVVERTAVELLKQTIEAGVIATKPDLVLLAIIQNSDRVEILRGPELTSVIFSRADCALGGVAVKSDTLRKPE